MENQAAQENLIVEAIEFNLRVRNLVGRLTTGGLTHDLATEEWLDDFILQRTDFNSDELFWELDSHQSSNQFEENAKAIYFKLSS